MPSVRFRIGDIPVAVDLSFFVMAFVVGGLNAERIAVMVVWIAVVAVSILIHELGHAVVFRAFGVRSAITLYAMGGVTTPTSGRALTPMRSVAVALAGPMAGFLIGGLAAALPHASTVDPANTAATVQLFVIWVNLVWGAINLLPIVPLDGGHVLQGILRRIARPVADDVAQVVSLVTLVPAAFLLYRAGFVFAPLVLGWFWLGGAQAWWRARQAHADREVLARIESATERTRAGDWTLAEPSAREALASARSRSTRHRAWLLLAGTACATNRGDLAEDVLRHAGGAITDPVGRATLLIVAGRAGEAIPLAYQAFRMAQGDDTGALVVTALINADDIADARSFARGPQAASLGPRTDQAAVAALYAKGAFAEAMATAFPLHAEPLLAYNVACCAARLGNLSDAVRWLTSAVESGWRDHGQMATDPDLAPLRGEPAFEALLERLRQGADQEP